MDHIESTEESIKKLGLLEKMKEWFKKEDDIEQGLEFVNVKSENDDEKFDFTVPFYAETELELKQLYLDHMLRFQIKWASSTILEKVICRFKILSGLEASTFFAAVSRHILTFI